ncbi:hypothetical protein JW877_01115 [bacterium]|nr:hypothetical protein [bacterium]
MSKLIIKTAFAFLLVYSMNGCLNPFAPPIEAPPHPWESRLEPTSPENVLENFRTAYTSRDSSLYFSCLNEAFIFRYWNDSLSRYDSYTLYDVEGKPGERTRTRFLFSTYESINLDVWNIIESSQRFEDSDTIELRRVWFSLRVEDFDFYIVQSAQGYACFEFHKIVQNSKPYYTIILWKDESQII